MIDLNDPDIMSSSEAAKRWHKADDYVRQMYRKTPEKFPEGSIRKFGKQLVVTRQGMEMVTGVTEAEAEENTARKQVS
ncbi:helix-turn-helix domain-containing protein [Lentilactobacillus kisonensis]|nr:helix-turn-helix domain-containing protein [Lentilactobacillus kisonensis]